MRHPAIKAFRDSVRRTEAAILGGKVALQAVA